MKSSILLILALIAEVFLLFIILLFFLVGLLGIFLPVMPGLLVIGAGAALYSLMIKNNYGAVTPKIHRRVVKIKDSAVKSHLIINSMGIFKNIRKRKQERVKEEILKNGVILFGFNLALVMAFIFAYIGLSIVSRMMSVSVLLVAFIPLMLIFMFAGASALVWYRFGQILGDKFKKRKVLNASLVTLISILPLLGLFLLFSAIISAVGGFGSEIFVVAFMGVLLMSVLSAVFELLIVNFGAITKK